MYVYIYICMLADMHKSIHVSVCMHIYVLCMYVCMEVRIHMFVGKHAQVYICLYLPKYICRKTCLIMYLCVHAYMCVCACI